MNLTAKQTETLEIVAAAGQISFYDKAITKVSVSALVRKGLLVIDADTYMVSLAAPAAVETETVEVATETVEVAAPVATETVEVAAPVATEIAGCTCPVLEFPYGRHGLGCTALKVEVIAAPVTPARTHWVTVDYTDEITGEVQRITDWYGTRSVARRAARFAQRHPRAALVGTSL